MADQGATEARTLSPPPAAEGSALPGQTGAQAVSAEGTTLTSAGQTSGVSGEPGASGEQAQPIQQEQGKPQETASDATKGSDQEQTATITDAAQVAAEVDPAAARTMIELLASANKMAKVLERKVASIKQEAVDPESGQVKDPAKLALALDLEIAGLQYQIDEYTEAAIKTKTGELSKSQQAKVAQLEQRKQQLLEQRTTGKIKTTKADGTEIMIESNQLPQQLNQVEAFAKAMGISSEQASSHPLYSVHQQIEGAITNPEFAQKLIEHMIQNKIFSQNEEENKQAVEKVRQYIEKTRQSIIKEHKNQERFKKAASAAGMVGLMMVLMMWTASREKKQGME